MYKLKPIAFACLLLLLAACSISYSFTGTSIDYTLVKSISIKDFPNQAAMVYPPLSQMLTEDLKDLYTRQTKLQMLTDNGDLELEGEITGYDIMQMAVKDDGFASQTRLTVTVRVRYSNRPKPEEDFEQTFSAYREFSADQMLDDVQDELCRLIVKEIIDQIYNSTVANW